MVEIKKPINGETYWPFLAEVTGIPKYKLDAACVKKVEITGVSPDDLLYSTVSVKLDDVGYTDIPIWIHTDVGTRKPMISGTEALEPGEYFRDAAFLFPLAETGDNGEGVVPTKFNRYSASDGEWASYSVEVSGPTEALALVFTDENNVIEVLGVTSVVQSVFKSPWYQNNWPTMRPYIMVRVTEYTGPYPVANLDLIFHSFIYDPLTSEVAIIPNEDFTGYVSADFASYAPTNSNTDFESVENAFYGHFLEVAIRPHEYVDPVNLISVARDYLGSEAQQLGHYQSTGSSGGPEISDKAQDIRAMHMATFGGGLDCAWDPYLLEEDGPSTSSSPCGGPGGSYEVTWSNTRSVELVSSDPDSWKLTIDYSYNISGSTPHSGSDGYAAWDGFLGFKHETDLGLNIEGITAIDFSGSGAYPITFTSSTSSSGPWGNRLNTEHDGTGTETQILTITSSDQPAVWEYEYTYSASYNRTESYTAPLYQHNSDYNYLRTPGGVLAFNEITRVYAVLATKTQITSEEEIFRAFFPGHKVAPEEPGVQRLVDPGLQIYLKSLAEAHIYDPSTWFNFRVAYIDTFLFFRPYNLREALI